MYIKIAITGRPNVGKSTIFNKIVQKNAAIAFDTPGITRDRIEAVCDFFDLKLKLVDTAGFDNTKSDDISISMVEQGIKAISDAEIVLFIVDGGEPLNRLDFAFVENLRKFDKEVILVCNKCENGIKPELEGDIYRLGFKNVVIISAEHKIGFFELSDMIKSVYIEKYGVNLDEAAKMDQESEEYIQKTDKLSIAIVGRPNAGKSTIFNKFLNENRSIVSETAGTTRDSIHKEIDYKGKKIDLVDTAGIRKRLNIDDKIEEFSVQSAFTAINFSTVVMLCMDAKSAFESQDLRIAKFAINEGRGVIVVLNKWDLLSEKERNNAIKDLDRFVENTFPKVKGLPFFTISGKFDESLDEILDNCIAINQMWSKRINTAKLNAFLRKIALENPPSRYKGHEVKIKYSTQVSTRPMHVCIFTNILEGVNPTYQTFLENEIRKEFKIFGVPIRLTIKKSDNPFAKKAQDDRTKTPITNRFKRVLSKSRKNKV